MSTKVGKRLSEIGEAIVKRRSSSKPMPIAKLSRLGYVVGKSITTNPRYFLSGRFFIKKKFKRLFFSQLESLVRD